MRNIAHSTPSIEAGDVEALTDQARSGMLAEGPATTAFEKAFADAIGITQAVACGSGSQGLLMALAALDAGPGAAVMMPDYTCAEVLAVVRHLGAQPVIVDVEDDYLLCVDAAAAAITDTVKAIVLPYTMGIFRDPSALRALGVPVVEDCAQFVDPAPHRVGAIAGDLAVFSFEGTKLLTAGEGGMIATRRPEMAERIREQKRFGDSAFKLNLFPLSDLQAALVRHQLERLPGMLARRAEIASRYAEALHDVPGASLPALPDGGSLFFRFPIRLNSAAVVDQAIADFAAHGIAARRPVTPLLSTFETPAHPTPRSVDLHARTLSIPIYPALDDEDVAHVISVARAVLEAQPLPARSSSR